MLIDSHITKGGVTMVDSWRVRFFFLLVLFTFISVAFVAQYQHRGHQIVSNVHFGSDPDGWQFYKGEADEIVVQGGGVSFYSPDLQTSTAIYQVITRQFAGQELQLKAVLRSEEVVAGKESHNKARLLFVQYVNGKARWDIPHSVVALAGTNEWQEVSEVFSVAPDCTEIRVIMQMSRCSGGFFLTDLSLYQVEETTVYRWVKWPMRAGWLSFVVFLVVPYLRRKKIIGYKLPVLITITAILIGTAMPATVKNNIKKTIDHELTPRTKAINTHILLAKDSLSQQAWRQAAMNQIDTTKIAHFALFALLVLILRYNNPTLSTRRLLFDIFLLACATELNQFFVENRSPLFTDVMIDMAGAGTGVLLSRKKNKPT